MLGDSIARKIKEYNGTKIILISAYELDANLIKELESSNYIRKYGWRDRCKLIYPERSYTV
jgi:hypothetical protein